MSYAKCGSLIGVDASHLQRIERGEAAFNLDGFREFVKLFGLGMVEAFQFLRLVPPGVTFREFQKFIKACRNEQLTPAKVLADFIRAYAES
jgi:hypothetical protein